MFVGRKKELQLLNQQYDSGKFEFTVLYGRRRIGKTELLKQYIQGKAAIYYVAIESNEQTNLELLSKSVHQYSRKEQGYAPFSDYMALFDHFTELAKNQRLILVIDEYPYLAEAYPEISSLIQKYCDNQWQETKLHLILCGSSMSFMENQVLGAKSPLYGRRTTQIRLKEFNYFETEELLRPMPKEDIAVLHCVTGGVAEYLKFVHKSQDLAANLISLFFTDSGRLVEEPLNFLKQELREPKVYNSILDAIARGASRNSEIASKVNLPAGSLNRYLENLMELGIVIKETPMGNSSSRKTIYRIRDGSFRFWYRYVFPNMSTIELGLGKRLYREYIEKDLSNYMGEGFEKIFLDHFDRMNEQGELPGLITSRGRWWGTDVENKREAEIDLVGKGGNLTIYAEVKWTNEAVGLKILTGLLEKSQLIHSLDKYYIVFSKRGFSTGAVEFAEQSDKIRLVSFLE